MRRTEARPPSTPSPCDPSRSWVDLQSMSTAGSCTFGFTAPPTSFQLDPGVFPIAVATVPIRLEWLPLMALPAPSGIDPRDRGLPSLTNADQLGWTRPPVRFGSPSAYPPEGWISRNVIWMTVHSLDNRFESIPPKGAGTVSSSIPRTARLPDLRRIVSRDGISVRRLFLRSDQVVWTVDPAGRHAPGTTSPSSSVIGQAR
jgi:hypothetical protein